MGHDVPPTGLAYRPDWILASSGQLKSVYRTIMPFSRVHFCLWQRQSARARGVSRVCAPTRGTHHPLAGWDSARSAPYSGHSVATTSCFMTDNSSQDRMGARGAVHEHGPCLRLAMAPLNKQRTLIIGPYNAKVQLNSPRCSFPPTPTDRTHHRETSSSTRRAQQTQCRTQRAEARREAIVSSTRATPAPSVKVRLDAEGCARSLGHRLVLIRVSFCPV